MQCVLNGVARVSAVNLVRSDSPPDRDNVMALLLTQWHQGLYSGDGVTGCTPHEDWGAPSQKVIHDTRLSARVMMRNPRVNRP